MLKVLGVIPARFASTRFPEKLLQKVIDKTVIQMVHERASQSRFLAKLVIATDHVKIYDHVKDFGGEVIMTSEAHQSGTDRCFEVLETYGGSKAYDFVLNIQGDEPLINPEMIDLLAGSLNFNDQIATLANPIHEIEELFSPNVVKVVKNINQEALYFSRSPIPFIRDVDAENWLNQHTFLRHVGMYAYAAEALEKISKISVADLEKLEKLEQLRWLANGLKIKVIETDLESMGIDTPEDLQKLRQFLKN
jgi:3-deoxy-manno-octulosonate cytidylyltransferase (CMP-KDO synthetase)